MKIPHLGAILLTILLMSACSQTETVKKNPILDGSNIDQTRIKVEEGSLIIDDIQANRYEVEKLIPKKEIKLLTTPEQFECTFYVSADGRLYGFRLGERGESSWFRPNHKTIGLFQEFIEELKKPVSAEEFSHIDGCYFRNKDHVIYEGYILDGANPDTFRSIDAELPIGTDGKNIYVEGYKVTGDPDSYKYVDDDYFSDKDNIYLLDLNWSHEDTHPALQIIKDADPASFTVLDGEYSKDANHVWYYSFYKTENNGLIAEADPLSFQAMEDQYFGKDNKNAYYKGKRIADASFEWIQFNGGNSRFAKDKEQVFYRRTHDPDISELFPVISNKPDSFKILTQDYQTDGEKVFYRGEILPGADAKTFQILDPNEDNFFKDKNRVYSHGKPVEVEGIDVASVKIIPKTGNLTDTTKRVYCKPNDDRLPWMVMDGASADDFVFLPEGFYKSGDKIYLYCYPDVNNYYQDALN